MRRKRRIGKKRMRRKKRHTRKDRKILEDRKKSTEKKTEKKNRKKRQKKESYVAVSNESIVPMIGLGNDLIDRVNNVMRKVENVLELMKGNWKERKKIQDFFVLIA